MFAPYSPAPTIIRYILLSFHLVILVLIFPMAGVLMLDFDFSFTVLETFTFFATLIYIPAAIILSARDSSSSFDHAGGEVAFLVVQVAGRIAEVVLTLLYRTTSSICWTPWPEHPKAQFRIDTECNLLIAVAALSLLDAVVLVGWITWLAVLAHRVPGRTPKQAYKIPAHRLVAGTFPEADLKYFMGGEEGEWTAKRMSGHSSVDEQDYLHHHKQYHQEPEQMVNPFTYNGHEDARMSTGASQLLRGDELPAYYVPPPDSMRQEGRPQTGAPRSKQGGYSYAEVGLDGA